MLWKCESLTGSRLGLTQVQEREHGARAPHDGKRTLGDVDLTLSAQSLEKLSSRAKDCTLKVATIGESISEVEVGKRPCANHCLLESKKTMGEAAVTDADKGYLFHSCSNVAKKIEAWIQKEISSSQYHGCTAACNENNVYNICVKTERKQYWCDATVRGLRQPFLVGLPAGSEP